MQAQHFELKDMASVPSSAADWLEDSRQFSKDLKLTSLRVFLLKLMGIE